MRLLNVHNLTLREFRTANLPSYAITSHRWVEDEEASINDIRQGLDLSKSGHRKVKDFAEYVVKNIPEIGWVWIDTCCIDKTSSQEVTEAINSMFKWYLNAEVCLAYLADVPTPEDIASFLQSTWFRRGWTLQELLAPHLVVFLSGSWQLIGHKGNDKSGARLQVGRSLAPRISATTRIPESVLHDYAQIQQFSAQAKLQWANNRATTREEDQVYCLLGLFDITMPVVYGEGAEKARKRLMKELAETGQSIGRVELGIKSSMAETSRGSPAARATTMRPIYLPFRRNWQFVGRVNELATLERKLLAEQDCQEMAIVGLGGVGKTQVALSFAYSVLENHFDFLVLWVSALSTESLEQGFKEIARLCNVHPVSDDEEDIKQLVKRHLSATVFGRWLLIVDNIDNTDLLEGSGQNDGLLNYLPQSTLGLTLFTTRNFEIAHSLAGSDIVELERMEQQDASDLLNTSLVSRGTPHDDATAAELLEQLDFLPLAITQAAAYININKISISEYVGLLHGTEQDLVHIMSTAIRDRTRFEQAANAIATTWIVSFNQIVQQDTIAANLLQYISCIEWKAIPRSILPATQSKARLTSAIGRLCSYSFLTRRSQEEIYDMHRLVHLAVRIWLVQKNKLDDIRKSAMQTLLQVFPSADHTKRHIWREYLPHAARICNDERGDNVKEKGNLCLIVGKCLLVDGRNKQAVQWLKTCRDLREDLQKDHPSRLASQHELARAYLANGQVKNAVKLLEHVVQICNKVLAEDYPDQLVSQYELAGAYLANGQVKDAVKLLEHVVRIQERVLAEDHPNQLVSQHVLAGAYLANGQVKDAVKLLEHVVRIQERVLAEDHPNQLASQHALAGAYLEDEQVREAVKLLKRIVQIGEKAFAEDHPAQLTLQHTHAIAYLEDDQVKEGVELLEHVVQIRNKVLAEDHPDQLASQHTLGRAYLKDGQVRKAVKLLEHVVQVKEKLLAEDHPDQLASQHALAGAYLQDGQVKEGVRLFEHVVRIEEKVLAEDHPSRLASQHALAEAYQESFRVDAYPTDSASTNIDGAVQEELACLKIGSSSARPKKEKGRG